MLLRSNKNKSPLVDVGKKIHVVAKGWWVRGVMVSKKSDLANFLAISDYFGKKILFIFFLTPPPPSGGRGQKGHGIKTLPEAQRTQTKGVECLGSVVQCF